jgi:hypothetical protein
MDGYNGAAERVPSGGGGNLTVDPDARQPMQADELDQVHDLGLGAAQEKLAVATAESIREHRQVHHQRSIGEVEITQVDDDIGLSPKSQHERAPAQALGAPILVSGTQQHRRVVGEL